MNLYLVNEATEGGWFVLSMVLMLMFLYMFQAAYRESGYNKPETQGALALAVYFLGSGLSRMYFWLLLWLPSHGYTEEAAALSGMTWWPVLANSLGLAGGLCALRVFFPWEMKKIGYDRLNQDASWLIPFILIILFLYVTSMA